MMKGVENHQFAVFVLKKKGRQFVSICDVGEKLRRCLMRMINVPLISEKMQSNI